MSGGLGFGSVVLLLGAVVANAASAQARTSQSSSRASQSAQQTNAEIVADVAIREHPRLTAAVIGDLTTGTAVRALNSKIKGWTQIAVPTRGWVPSETVSILAATSSGTAAGGGRDRSDSDLMLEALTASRGESPNAARINRVVRETAIESKKKRKRMVAQLHTIWKDPFADDSEPAPPVQARRAVSPRTLQAGADVDVQAELSAARRETSRARADAAAARADAAATRADAAHVKAELARREATAAHADAIAAKHDAEEARAGCKDVASLRRVSPARSAGWRDASLRGGSQPERAAKPRPNQDWNARTAVRWAPTTRRPQEASLAKQAAPANPLPPPTEPRSVASTPPPVVPSQSPNAAFHGILVVPINASASAR